jgi:hypothetical protein
MESATAPVPRTDELIPPPDPQAAYRVALAGLGLSAAAALLGVASAVIWGDTPAVWDGVPSSAEAIPTALHTARLVLVGLGALLAGSAISMRPGLWRLWLLATGTGILAAVIGLPDHWDSARLLARVLTALAMAGAALAALKPVYRYSVVSLAVLFHFGGILTATTWPQPTPWITEQLAGRVYQPYLTFVYMRNAYHFYSPEPGPASQLFVLVKYEGTDPATGKPPAEWEILPRRDQHMKDPLGLTYYRRLSITEAVAGTIPDLFSAQTFEKLDAKQRRVKMAYGLAGKDAIPLAPQELEPQFQQYRVPRQDITRYLLPSYARHICIESSAATGRRVVSVKFYRAEHRITPIAEFIDRPTPGGGVIPGKDPYYPDGYRVYYLGEYTPDGTLVNPQDEMLYWLVPIYRREGGPSPTDPDHQGYYDFLTKHAGYKFEWERMRP